MVESKFADLHDRSIDGDPIQHVKEDVRGHLTVTTLKGNYYSFDNLTHLYQKLDVQPASLPQVQT